jgi:hypothetical protein
MPCAISAGAVSQSLKWKRQFTPCRGNALNSGDSIAEKIFLTVRNGMAKTYATKQVRPVFVEEAAEVVVVTVYTYYF